MPEPFPFVDLQAQRRRLQPELDAAIRRVLEHGRYVNGAEVDELEAELAVRSQTPHVVSCSSGADALILALMACGVGSGDAVIVPSFTFAATAEAAVLVGAAPIFVDCLPDSFTIDPAGIREGIDVAREIGLRPAAVIAVDLFGQPADHDGIGAAADGLAVVVDAAQSFGATWRGRPTLAHGTVATTSFFPSKPLGAYGDGGAVFTADAEIAACVRSLREHGYEGDKYHHARVGITGRLDTLQAAILLTKLSVFDDELTVRRELAARYTKHLPESVIAPSVTADAEPVWAQYTVRVAERDRVMAHMTRCGVPTAIHYPIPLHRQPAYADLAGARRSLPVTERACREVLSVPIHPYLSEGQQDLVIRSLAQAVRGG